MFRGTYNKLETTPKKEIAILSNLNAIDLEDNQKVVVPFLTLLVKLEESDRTTFFNILKLDKALETLLNQATDSLREDKEQKDKAIIEFVDQHNKINQKITRQDIYRDLEHSKNNDKYQTKLYKESASILQTPQIFLSIVKEKSLDCKKAQRENNSQTRKYIKDLESCNEDLQFILIEDKEKELLKIYNVVYNKYITQKLARLDAIKTDHLEYNILYFSVYADNYCLIHLSNKKATYFPKKVKLIYKARIVVYQIYTLSKIIEN